MTNFNYQRPLDKISFGGAVNFMVLAAFLAAYQANTPLDQQQKTYSIPNSSSSSLHDYFSTEAKSYSNLLARIDEIKSLDDNWNDFGASKFSAELIGRTKEFLYSISEMSHVISIFPTAVDSIQLEWEKESTYAEAEVFLDRIKIYAEVNDKEVANISSESINDAATQFLKIYNR